MKVSGFRQGVAEARDELARRWLGEGLHTANTIPQAIAASTRSARLVIRSETNPGDLTREEIIARSAELAGAMARMGIGEGDVVSFQLPTWPEAVQLSLATYMLGAILVPIVSIYGPKEVAFILEQSRAKLFVSPSRWGTIDYIANMRAWPELPDLEHVVVIGETSASGHVRWKDFVNDATPDFPKPHSKSDDVCAMVYTSGTTSEPKGVLHTHRTLLAENLRLRSRTLTGPRLAALPMGHIGGISLPLGLLLDGGLVVTMDRWDARTAARLVAEHKVTSTAGTPFFLVSLLKAAEEEALDVSSLSDFMLGATAITPEDVSRCDRTGITGYRTYGSTEHPVALTGNRFLSSHIRAQTEGFPTAATEIRLVAEDGTDVRDGEEGEIALIGPQQFVGYADPALNAEHFLSGGWFLTGDMARRDATGAFVITDRKKDIIIRGGENISAKEVEDTLASMASVAEAAVVAMPDERYGEKICAFLVLGGNESVGIEEVQAHFNSAGLARQKTPERIEVISEFPRTHTGKIKKFVLRQWLLEQITVY